MFCKNCGNKLSDDQSYCPKCGAKIVKNRFTVNYLSNEFFESFWSIDSNKPLLTFLHLFKKPVEVIGGYIAGLRKRYINPFGYFTIALTLTGLQTFLTLNYFPEYLDSSGLKANIGDRDISREVTTSVLEHINLITFLFIPIIALLSRLCFLKNKRYNLAEHLIIHLYAYSHITIVSACLMLLAFSNKTIFRIMNFINLPLYIIYYFYLFRKLYELSFWKVLLKTFLFLLLIGFLFFGMSFALAFYITKNSDQLANL